MASGRRVEHHILNSMEETPSHFFKVILPETLSDKKMRIPDMFVRKYGEDLSAFATLTAPNGRVWRVGLRKDGRKTWFDKGWHDFIEYHSITAGYFLVFKYVKDSNFHVLVFDLSACEITYPYNREEPENIGRDLIHQDEMESEDSAGFIHSRMPKPTSSPLAKSCSDKWKGKRPSSNMDTAPLQQNRPKPCIDSAQGINRYCNCATSGESLKFENDYVVQTNTCKMEEPEEGNQSNTVDESGRGYLNRKEMYDSQGSLNRKRNLDGNCKHSSARSPLVHCNDLKLDRTRYKAIADNNAEDEHPKEVVGNEKKVAYKVVSPLDHHKDHKIDRTENRETKDDGDDEEDDDDDRTKFDALELMIALEDAGISYSGRYRCLLAEERERALNVVRLLRPKNPSFMVILRSYHAFGIKNCLYVPTKFANNYLSGDVHVRFIKLQASDGREWPVQIVRKHNGVSLRNGWAEFSRDKNLEEGDICVFELVRREDILLKMSVFHETIE